MKGILDRIRTVLEAEDDRAEHSEDDVRLAAAVLMVEMSRADHDVGDDEREAVKRAVTQTFRLEDRQADELIRAAEAEAEAAVSLHRFTDRINRNWNPEDKRRLVEALWRVAFSDREMHALEEHLVRKLADLLYVPHREFLQAKHRVQAELDR